MPTLMQQPRAASISLVSWVRQGLAADVAPSAATARLQAGRLAVPVQLRLNEGETIAVPLQFYGPGEVVGIDARQVIRTDPPPLAVACEPNYFPLIEFDMPHLPWMFTPAAPDALGRLQPWICLIAVPEAIAQLQVDPARPLPMLNCPLVDLPPLDESWAWAHAQVVQRATPVTVSELLGDAPRSLSRLLCPRRLRPDTTYLACVVPTYELGRKTGLGETPSAADRQALAFAWAQPQNADPATRVALPVYYHWKFTTGADGDFEALARRLQPRSLPEAMGMLPVDTSTPGWGLLPVETGDPSAILVLEGALRPIDREARAWPSEVTQAFRTRLRPMLDRPAVELPSGVTLPLVAPPLYGQSYAQLRRLPGDNEPPVWWRELNLDLGSRIAAGLGSMMVRFEQESLMAAAWEQLADWQQENQQRRRGQLAEVVEVALRARRPPVTARSLASTATLSEPVATTAPETPGFAPEFATPMGALLRDYFPEFLLPGLGQVAPNSITLVETNQQFVEAFMVGLNHEIRRELLWRGYPAHPRATYCRRFWDVGGRIPPVSEPYPGPYPGPYPESYPGPYPGRLSAAGDITPIETWPEASALGQHRPPGAASSNLVLLLRGEVLQRFPRATVYAVEAQWPPAGGTQRVLGDHELYPFFRIPHAPDIMLLGFDLSVAEARGSDVQGAGHPGWFFVLQEQPTEPRFGLDAPSATYGRGGLTQWRDLSWSHLVASREALERVVYVTLAMLPSGMRLPLEQGSARQATWGANAAQSALIVHQKPFRIAMHARVWLPT